MAAVYANRIIRLGQDPVNPFTIENVIKMYKESTLAELARRGYDGYGLPL